MNKLLLTITLTLVLTLGFTAITYAESGSFWFSGGSKDGYGNFAVGFGGRDIGIEIGIIDNDNLPSGTLDYECPHWDYTSLGHKTIEPSVGIDLIGMFHISDHVMLYGGPGLYWHHTGEIVRSNSTGWLYTQSNETSTEIACSGGIRFRFTKGTRFGIGYHTLRGSNLTFQFSF